MKGLKFGVPFVKRKGIGAGAGGSRGWDVGEKDNTN